jgi:predicted HicB family RNase H-like nuclease
MTAENIKRLTIEVDQKTHKEIKQISAEKDMSMKKYILQALAEQVKRDFALEFGKNNEENN